MNIAEILKYCPKGTKLYSTIFGEVTFDRIDIDEEYPIMIYKIDGMKTSFTEEGYYTKYPNSECVLFPSKDQRDWEKFKFPIKDGDIMMTIDKRAFITNGKINNDNCPCAYCGINTYHDFTIGTTTNGWTALFYIPASEEAKKELFDKMKEAGYRWNADTLELEKIESEFKEGDVVVDNSGSLCLVSKAGNYNFIVVSAVLCTDGLLMISDNSTIKRNIKMITLAPIKNRNKLFSALAKEGYKYDKWQHKLIKQKFKPFDKVLVRNKPNEKWLINIFSHYDEENKDYPYVCLLNGRYSYCAPYEGNEYLVGKND